KIEVIIWAKKIKGFHRVVCLRTQVRMSRLCPRTSATGRKENVFPPMGPWVSYDISRWTKQKGRWNDEENETDLCAAPHTGHVPGPADRLRRRQRRRQRLHRRGRRRDRRQQRADGVHRVPRGRGG